MFSPLPPENYATEIVRRTMIAVLSPFAYIALFFCKVLFGTAQKELPKEQPKEQQIVPRIPQASNRVVEERYIPIKERFIELFKERFATRVIDSAKIYIILTKESNVKQPEGLWNLFSSAPANTKVQKIYSTYLQNESQAKWLLQGFQGEINSVAAFDQSNALSVIPDQTQIALNRAFENANKGEKITLEIKLFIKTTDNLLHRLFWEEISTNFFREGCTYTTGTDLSFKD